MTIEFKDVKERTRTYYFPDNQKIQIQNVVRFAAPGTTHRLETKNGEKFIINAGWLAILVEVDEWSF